MAEQEQEPQQEQQQGQQQESAAESCDSACSSCASDCASRTEPQDFRAKTNEASNIKHIIAVVSGKGGVGKSLVTSLLATVLQKSGKKVGILDADITGPSIPRAFGIEEKLTANELGIIPSVSVEGIQIVSTNLILPDETTPVIWRGSIISNMVRQFFSEVNWGELDYLLIDMPPGTGDVPLTVYQSLPIDGIVIVTAPQALVSMIVGKAINMAGTMEIPVLGLVENMSYFECPACGERHTLFGPSSIEALAQEYAIDLTAALPISPCFASKMDAGEANALDTTPLEAFAHSLVARIEG